MTQLLKAVTFNKSLSATQFLSSQVTEVTVKVTSKSIDIDILYSIVTLVTLKLICAYARAHAHIRGYVFSGNQVTGKANRYAAIEKTVTFWVTLVTFKPQKLPENTVTYGVI